MKTALSKILEFFVGHDRREKNNPAHRDYCICGAPKPALKSGLEDAAKHLDDLAAEVAKGTVKSVKELNDAFARADLALARHYHEMAKAVGCCGRGKPVGETQKQPFQLSRSTAPCGSSSWEPQSES